MLLFSNVMLNTHTPPHKPLNYVLDDLPLSPAACPILGQQLCRRRREMGTGERERDREKNREKSDDSREGGKK